MKYNFSVPPRFPENDVRITAYYKDPEYQEQFKAVHYGVDMAEPVRNCEIYAVADGEIAGVTDPTDPAKLKHMTIRHDSLLEGKRCWSRYYHFSGFAPGIQAGVKVKIGQLIGYQGSSGYSTGPHLELQFWITPPDYVLRSGADVAKYSVNPLDCVFLYPDQKLGRDPKKEVKKLPETPITPLEAGTVLECIAASGALYYRTAPKVAADTAAGFLTAGRYHAVATTENEGYLWVKFVLGDAFFYSALLEGYDLLIPPGSGGDFEKLYLEEKQKNILLTAQLDTLGSENALLKKQLTELTAEKNAVSAELKAITDALSVLKAAGN